MRTLIVDEIHAVADDKRGSHLALSIARLEALTGSPLQKIGLSATVSPIEEVAQFLSPRAKIVQVGRKRMLDLAVEVPRDELGAVASTEMWGEIYDRVAALALGASHHAGLRQHPQACPSASRTIWASAWARTRCCRITAACRAACAWKPSRN